MGGSRRAPQTGLLLPVWRPRVRGQGACGAGRGSGSFSSHSAHCVHSGQRGSGWGRISGKSTGPIHEGSTPMTSSAPKAPPTDPPALGVRVSTKDFWAYTDSQALATWLCTFKVLVDVTILSNKKVPPVSIARWRWSSGVPFPGILGNCSVEGKGGEIHLLLHTLCSFDVLCDCAFAAYSKKFLETRSCAT